MTIEVIIKDDAVVYVINGAECIGALAVLEAVNYDVKLLFDFFFPSK